MPDDGCTPARDDGRESDAALRCDYFTSPGRVPQCDGVSTTGRAFRERRLTRENVPLADIIAAYPVISRVKRRSRGSRRRRLHEGSVGGLTGAEY